MAIAGGQVISSVISAAFAHAPHGWFYVVAMGDISSILLAYLLPFCPESPRQLIWQSKLDQAEEVIRRIYCGASEQQVKDKILLIKQARDESKAHNYGESRWSKIKQLHTVPSNLRALVCAYELIVISQMTGTLFEIFGFKNPVAVSTVVAGANFIMTWTNVMLVDPIGRRRILLITAWGMIVGLVFVTTAFSFIPVDQSTLAVTSDNMKTPAIVVRVFVIVFAISYGVSVGNTAWLSTDLPPLQVRVMGTMRLTCSWWGFNIIVSSNFSSMIRGITPFGASGFYAAVCANGYILIYFLCPEVSGLTLEEVRESSQHGFGVKFAKQLRKERAAGVKERMTDGPRNIAVGH